MPFANHVGVLFLLGAGAYLVYYWAAVAPVGAVERSRRPAFAWRAPG